MEASTGPLLKVYYDNCPGCKQDRKNEVRRGVPYREFFFIWIVTLCSGNLTNSIIVSFLILHDRYGRKPVIVSSTRGLGLIIGPAIGGFFAQVLVVTINCRFPYFLPCFCISLLAIGALVVCFWLPVSYTTLCLLV
ncbi:hypothetical protein GW17_00002490 [Ensete ventricosum]|nr:hypothetical protein GW17_00002490 [Ensete ventricosum]